MRKTFNNYFETPLLWVILIVFLLLLFAVLLFEIDLRNRQHILEKEALSKHLLEEKYLNLNEVYSQNARLYHDLNNHLIALDHLLDDANIPEAKRYIAAIQEPVQILKKTHWTGDDVVDAVLNNKIQIMENRKIHYEIQTDFPDKTGIEAADLCTLLANLLDNAIEAVEKLPEQTYPLKIRIQSIKKFVIIDISNPSREIKFTDDGLPRKTRKSSFHGWGSAQRSAGRRKIQWNHSNLNIKTEYLPHLQCCSSRKSQGQRKQQQKTGNKQQNYFPDIRKNAKKLLTNPATSCIVKKFVWRDSSVG